MNTGIIAQIDLLNRKFDFAFRWKIITMSLVWRYTYPSRRFTDCGECLDDMVKSCELYHVEYPDSSVSWYCEYHFPLRFWKTVRAYAIFESDEVIKEIFSVDEIRVYSKRQAKQFVTQKI